MRKYLSAYAPSLRELWLIMIVLLCLGGGIVSGVASVVVSKIFKIDLISVSLALYPLQFLLAILFIRMRSQENYREQIKRGVPLPQEAPPSFGSIHGVLFFALLAALLPAFSIATEPVSIPISLWLPMPESLKEFFGEIGNQGWVSIFSLVIMAPLLEEWLCRGVALKGLIKNGYSPTSAIIWSAFMFGIIHLNPWQALPAFLMGLLFGWIYWRTKSLWSVIFLHAVNNGLSVAIDWAYPDLPEEAAIYELVGTQSYFWILGGAIVVSASIVWFFHRKLTPTI